MFRGGGFLLGEIWILIALAALLGLVIGWLVWGRRSVVVDDSEVDRLRAELDACQTRARGCAQRVAKLEAEISTLRSAADAEKMRRKAAQSAAVAGSAEEQQVPDAAPETAQEADSGSSPGQNVSVAPTEGTGTSTGDGRQDGAADEAGVKPTTLDAPRAGVADDLKRIKGIGPKLEALCNRLGFWHFDQIANWNDAEIAWVDANLESFKGRVTRDNWVAQARELAAENSD